MGNHLLRRARPDAEGYTGCCVKNDFGAMVRNPKENAKCEDDGLRARSIFATQTASAFIKSKTAGRYRRGTASLPARLTPKIRANRASPSAADPLTKVTWTKASVGTACDDGNPCTTGDKCFKRSGMRRRRKLREVYCGGIFNQTVACNDDNPCTVDYCGKDGRKLRKRAAERLRRMQRRRRRHNKRRLHKRRLLARRRRKPARQTSDRCRACPTAIRPRFQLRRSVLLGRRIWRVLRQKIPAITCADTAARSRRLQPRRLHGFVAGQYGGRLGYNLGPMSSNKTMTKIATTSARQVCAGDLKGDGVVVLVFVNYSGASQVFFNNRLQPGIFDVPRSWTFRSRRKRLRYRRHERRTVTPSR
jgi:hypothetical protein